MKAYRIHLLPIKIITEQFFIESMLDKAAFIACSSYRERLQRIRHARNYLAISFADGQHPDDPPFISQPHCEQIRLFIEGLEDNITDLYICTDRSEVRGPAIAAALLRASGRSDSGIWNNPYYHPSTQVFSAMCKAFHVYMPRLFLCIRRRTSARAFRQCQRNNGQTSFRFLSILNRQRMKQYGLCRKD